MLISVSPTENGNPGTSHLSASEQRKRHPLMKRNYLTWLAMSLSATAGMFCSQFASKYTDGRIEAAISVPVQTTDVGSGTAVALIREAPAVGDRTKN
jgi:hypothetical protein